MFSTRESKWIQSKYYRQWCLQLKCNDEDILEKYMKFCISRNYVLLGQLQTKHYFFYLSIHSKTIYMLPAPNAKISSKTWSCSQEVSKADRQVHNLSLPLESQNPLKCRWRINYYVIHILEQKTGLNLGIVHSSTCISIRFMEKYSTNFKILPKDGNVSLHASALY